MPNPTAFAGDGVLSPRFLACMPFILKEEGGYSNDAQTVCLAGEI